MAVSMHWLNLGKTLIKIIKITYSEVLIKSNKYINNTRRYLALGQVLLYVDGMNGWINLTYEYICRYSLIILGVISQSQLVTIFLFKTYC